MKTRTTNLTDIQILNDFVFVAAAKVEISVPADEEDACPGVAVSSAITKLTFIQSPLEFVRDLWRRRGIRTICAFAKRVAASFSL